MNQQLLWSRNTYLRGHRGQISLPGADANADLVAILLIWWMPGLRRWSRWCQENARLTSSVWLASGKCRVISSVGLASGKCPVDVVGWVDIR